MIPALGIAALTVALAVTAGGVALRLGGALAFWVGVAALTSGGDPRAVWVAAAGAAAWGLGQAHFALRHGGTAKGPTAALLLAGSAALWRRLVCRNRPAEARRIGAAPSREARP